MKLSDLREKAVSKQQQKFMGMVRAKQKGEMDDASPEVEKAAKSMSKKDVKDFASTKHKGLPNKVEEGTDKAEIQKQIDQAEKHLKTFSGNTSSVKMKRYAIQKKIEKLKAKLKEETQLDELSIDKLRAYRKKAVDDVASGKKTAKRTAGVVKSTNKIYRKEFDAQYKKESVDLDEETLNEGTVLNTIMFALGLSAVVSPVAFVIPAFLDEIAKNAEEKVRKKLNKISDKLDRDEKLSREDVGVIKDFISNNKKASLRLWNRHIEQMKRMANKTKTESVDLDENIFYVMVGQGKDSMSVKTKANNKKDALAKMKKKYPSKQVKLDPSQEQDIEESVDLDEAYKTPAEAGAIAAGKKAARQGKKYSDNPHTKGTPEFTAWSKGHNMARESVELGEAKISVGDRVTLQPNKNTLDQSLIGKAGVVTGMVGSKPTVKFANGKTIAVSPKDLTINESVQKSFFTLREARRDAAKDLYFDTYSAAVQTALADVKKKGFEVDEDDWHDSITTGPGKPGRDKTVRHTISLTKGGKPQRKALHIQVYNRNTDKKTYELNYYVS